MSSPPVPKKVVVYVHSWLPRQTDGVAVRFLAHVRELVRKGADVTLVTPEFLPAKSRGDFVVVDGVRHIQLDTTFTPGYKRSGSEKGGIPVMCPKSSPENLRRLVEVLKEVKPDIVHMAQCASMIMVSCACLIVGVPLVMSVHTDIRASAATTTAIAGSMSDFGLLMSWLVGATFLPVSANAQSVLETAGVGGTKGLVRWGPMVDTKVFHPKQDAARVEIERRRLTYGNTTRFLMTYVGRFSLEKDVRFLIEALRRAPDNLTLALIGDGPLGPEFAELAKQLAPKLFCEPKFVDREAVAIALAASDLGVSASCMETTGFCAIESIACGTPFLAADSLGFHEHLTSSGWHRNARLYTPGDAMAFDDALRNFVEDKQTGRWADREVLSDTVRSARVSDCTDRALRAYTHRLHRPLVARLLLAPITSLTFLYNSFGERLFNPNSPELLLSFASIPIGSLLSVVLPAARLLCKVCKSRVSMWGTLSAIVFACGYSARQLLRLSAKRIAAR